MMYAEAEHTGVLVKWQLSLSSDSLPRKKPSFLRCSVHFTADINTNIY